MWDFWRNWRKPAAEKQLEMLNAYLDDALTPRQREALEAKLGQDEALRAELAQLRQVHDGLRQLPRRRAPRNFTLDPALYGRPQRQPLVQAYPVLRVATVLTAFFFVLAIALQTISPPHAMLFTAAEPAAAPAEQVAMDKAPTLVAREAAEGAVTRVVTETVLETVVETVLESAPRTGAADEMPAATPAAEATAAEATAAEATASSDIGEETGALAAPPSAELFTAPESGLAAYPVPAATSSPTPDIPRLAQGTETARAAEVAGEREQLETAVVPTPVPETAIPPQASPIPWLPVSLGVLLVLLAALTLMARRHLL